MATYGEVLVEESSLAPAGALRVLGDFDIALREPFIDALEIVVTPDAERVVVDLTGVEFFDENGLARLLATRAKTRRLDMELVLVGAPSCVRARLETGGVTDLFTFAAV